MLVSGIILSAGKSERMGRDKALLKCGGRRFVEKIISDLLSIGIDRIFIVLGEHNFVRIKREADLNPAEILINKEVELGQLHSVKLATERLTEEKAEAFMLCLVDQPLVKKETYGKIVDFFKENCDCIVIPMCLREARNRKSEGGELRRGKDPKNHSLYKRGHPIIIPRVYWNLILETPAGESLHWVTHHKKVKVKDVIVDDSNILKDFDTPRDYAG